MSLPGPPSTSSEPPRPRTSSLPFSPASSSGLSVPKSRPPLGQPGRSFVVKRAGRFMLIFRVPSHRPSSSDSVALGELPCSFLLEVSELVPAQPTTRRRTAHPIRKVPTTGMRCPRRITAHPPSLCMGPLLLAPRSMPHQEAWRISQGGVFTGVRGETVWKLRIGSITGSHEPAERANEHLFGAWRHRKARDRTRPATFQTVSGNEILGSCARACISPYCPR